MSLDYKKLGADLSGISSGVTRKIKPKNPTSKLLTKMTDDACSFFIRLAILNTTAPVCIAALMSLLEANRSGKKVRSKC